MQSPKEEINGGRSRISLEIIFYDSQLTHMQSYVSSLGLYLCKCLHILICFPDIVLPNYVVLFVVHDMMLPNFGLHSVNGGMIGE
jgi:hypothetical protein